MKLLKKFIDECVRNALYEAKNISYRDTATPLVLKRLTGHAKGLDDPSGEPSTITPDEEGFISQKNIVVSDNKFTIYKIKNFGNDKIEDTMSFFGGSTVELTRAIHTVNGAAKRNGKPLYYRTITSESNKDISRKRKQMYKTFWEFSFDGNEWYILKPNPVQSLKISKF